MQNLFHRHGQEGALGLLQECEGDTEQGFPPREEELVKEHGHDGGWEELREWEAWRKGGREGGC